MPQKFGTVLLLNSESGNKSHEMSYGRTFEGVAQGRTATPSQWLQIRVVAELSPPSAECLKSPISSSRAIHRANIITDTGQAAESFEDFEIGHSGERYGHLIESIRRTRLGVSRRQKKS